MSWSVLAFNLILRDFSLKQPRAPISAKPSTKIKIRLLQKSREEIMGDKRPMISIGALLSLHFLALEKSSQSYNSSSKKMNPITPLSFDCCRDQRWRRGKKFAEKWNLFRVVWIFKKNSSSCTFKMANSVSRLWKTKGELKMKNEFSTVQSCCSSSILNPRRIFR